MPHIHFTFQKRQSEMRESRLIGEEGADKYKKGPSAVPTSAEALQKGLAENPEKNKENWRKVFDTLKISPDYKGDAEAQKLLEDDTILTMIASMVTIRDDNKVNWLPETAQMFAEKYLDVFLSEPKKVTGMKEAATTSVQRFAKLLDANIASITKLKDLQDYEDDDNKLLPNVDAVVRVLEAIRATDKILADRQHALIDLANTIVKTDVIDREFLEALSQRISQQQHLGSLYSELSEVVSRFMSDTTGEDHANGDSIDRNEHPKLFARAQKTMLDAVVSAGRLLLSGPNEGVTDASLAERKSLLIDAKGDAKAKIKRENDREQNLLNRTDYVKAEARYLEWMSGKNVELLITGCIDANGKLNLDKLQSELLKVNKKKPLTIGDLISASGINTQNAFSQSRAKEFLGVLQKSDADAFNDTNEVNLIEAAQILLQEGFDEAKAKFPLLKQWMIPHLLSIWDTKPLMGYLKEKKVIENTITSGMSRVVLRAYLGEEPADELVKSSISGLRIGTLIDLSKMSEFFQPKDQLRPTKEILELIAPKSAGVDKRYVFQPNFVTLVQFISDVSRDEAEARWKKLIGTRVVTDKGVEMETKELEEAISNIVINIDSKMLLQKLDNAGSGEPQIDDQFLSKISRKIQDGLVYMDQDRVLNLFTFLLGSPSKAQDQWERLVYDLSVSDVLSVQKEDLQNYLKRLPVNPWAARAIPSQTKDLINAGTRVVDPRLLSAVSEKVGDDENRRTVDKENFIQVVTFLLLNDGVNARAEAEKVWDGLAGASKDKDAVEVDTLRLQEVLQKVGITETAFTYMKHMRDKGVATQSYTTDIHDLTLSGFETLQQGTAQWWEWVRQMPGFYIGNDIDAELRTIAKRRDALNAYTAAIDSTLAAADGTANPIANSRDELITINTAQRAAKSRPTLPNGAIDNVEQGYVTVMASGYVIDQLNKMGWSTLPEKAQMAAFSIAMRDKAGNGIESAQKFIVAFRKASGETTGLQSLQDALPDQESRLQRLMFHVSESKLRQMKVMISGFDALPSADKEKELFAALSPEQRQELFLQITLESADSTVQSDVKRFAQLKKLSGESILEGPKNAHGLDLHESAMAALMGVIRTECANGDLKMLPPEKKSMLVERWMTDSSGSKVEKDAIAKALRIVVSGPDRARNALIKAFLEQTDQEYEYSDGTTKMITAIEANTIVGQFQTVLQTKAAQGQPAKEQLSGKDVRSNPVERGVRATLETIKDLWDGDMVNKATVVATLLVSLWAIRKAWNEAGKKDAPGWTKLLKAGLIATPLLIVGNAAVKRQTGKDYLGEWFSYMPKEKRNAPLESFRRRSAEETRYNFMDSAAGHEALRQLTGSKVKIPICDLIKWRESIRQSLKDGELGSDVYEHGAPEGLKVSAIRSALPKGATKDEAYKTAYLAFEALCVDVAVIKGLGGGTLDGKANEGADFIEKRYVSFEGYADQPEVREQLKKRSMSMLEIIIDISNTPETLDAVKDDPNFTEWADNLLRKGSGATKAFFIKYKAQLELRAMRGAELAPEIVAEAWDIVGNGAENIYDWYRITKPKITNDVMVGLGASWRTFLDLCDATGIVVTKGLPGAVNIVADTTKAVTDYSLDTAQKLYEFAREHQTIGNVVSGIDDALLALFGGNIVNLLALRNTVKDDTKHVEKLADDVRIQKELETTLKSVVELPANFDAVLKNAKERAKDDLGFDSGDSLTANETMAVIELVKRRMYSAVIARRMDELKERYDSKTLQNFKYPLASPNLWDWEKLKTTAGTKSELADDIEQTYGLNTLSLIGLEQNFSGDYKEWVEQQGSGYARKPLEFVNWLLERSTFTDARRYLEHDIARIRNQYLNEAREAYAKIPDQNAREEKLRLYTFYLETLLTNVTIESALGLPNKGNAVPGGLSKKAFSLLDEKAKELREYVLLYRGSSANPEALKKVNFSAFECKESSGSSLDEMLKEPKFRGVISSSDPSVVPPEKKEDQEKSNPDGANTPPKNSKSQEDSAQKKVENTTFDMTTEANQKELLNVLPGASRDLKVKIHKLFDARASELLAELGANAPNNDKRAEIYRLLRGVSKDAPEKNSLRDALLKGMEPESIPVESLDFVKLKELIKERSKGNDSAPFQDVLDRAAIQYLDYIANDLKTKHFKDETSIAKFITPENVDLRESYAEKLAELYKATSTTPDSVSDTVSQLIEIVHYFGDYKSYEDYVKYLKGLGIKNPPDQAKYSYDKAKSGFYFTNQYGPRNRLGTKIEFTKAHLEQSGFTGRLNAIKGQRGMK